MPKVATRVDVQAVLVGLMAAPPDDSVETRVLGAAVRLLLRDGLAGFELDAVADRCGVGRSTIYRRFGDRNGLLSATVAHEGRRILVALAEAVADIEDPVEQVVAAFAAGLRMARDGDFAALIRDDPHLLRLLTVDAGPLVAVATEQLVMLGRERLPGIDERMVRGAAEVLVRQALSFVVTPSSALDLRDDAIEDTVRAHLIPTPVRSRS